jgi:hypothetical protein
MPEAAKTATENHSGGNFRKGGEELFRESVPLRLNTAWIYRLCRIHEFQLVPGAFGQPHQFGQ